jgi:hypothetical protein
VDPAAEATILNADDRPYRENAAAAGNGHGRGVDHGRGYKAAPDFRQVGNVIPGRRDSDEPGISHYDLGIPGSMLRIAPE